MSKSIKGKKGLPQSGGKLNHKPIRQTKKKLGKVVVKYDVGFNNALYIRGQGAGLSWDKGVLLKNISPDEWEWEPAIAFNECEFKVLVNDTSYEGGENHHLSPGSSVQYTPSF